MRTVGPHPVSVIAPMYNGMATVEKTLSSIFAQTCGDLDIMDINDGGTDQSTMIVQHWHDSRVKLVSKLSARLSAARKSGVAATQADLVSVAFEKIRITFSRSFELAREGDLLTQRG